MIVEIDDRPVAVLAVGDTLGPTSREAVREVRALGIEPVLVSGDGAAPARAMAELAGIDTVHAGVTPEEKEQIVRALRAEGRCVAVIGDGVNDAAALASADLGMAMGGGTDAAIGAADITLVRDDMLAVVDAVRLTRRTLSTIRANLAWAFGYNVVTVPLAATGWLNPMVAAAAMSASPVPRRRQQPAAAVLHTPAGGGRALRRTIHRPPPPSPPSAAPHGRWPKSE